MFGLALWKERKKNYNNKFLPACLVRPLYNSHLSTTATSWQMKVRYNYFTVASLFSALFLHVHVASLPSQHSVWHLCIQCSMLLCEPILGRGVGGKTPCSCRIPCLPGTLFGIGHWLFSSPLKASLEMLTNKLRTLNGEIKDPRAAFMNRTKVCINK